MLSCARQYAEIFGLDYQMQEARHITHGTIAGGQLGINGRTDFECNRVAMTPTFMPNFLFVSHNFSIRRS